MNIKGNVNTNSKIISSNNNKVSLYTVTLIVETGLFFRTF